MVVEASYVHVSDVDLVTNIKTNRNAVEVQAMTHALYMRYMNFIHKHWHALSRQLNDSYLVQDIKDDFYSESYVSFSKALAAVSLDKIKDEKWKFLGYLGFYLSNQRNAFAKRLIKKYNVETPIEIPVDGDHNRYLTDIVEHGTVSSAEDTFFKEEEQRRFWDGLAYYKGQVWSDIERRIFTLREQGKSIKSICTDLQISPGKCGKLLGRMGRQLKEHAGLN